MDNVGAIVTLIQAQAERGGPLGPEFGKASPIGLFVLVLLGVIVLYIGWALSRRVRRMSRRREFAAAHGLDPFDVAAIDAAMEREGLVVDKRRWF